MGFLKVDRLTFYHQVKGRIELITLYWKKYNAYQYSILAPCSECAFEYKYIYINILAYESYLSE